MGNSTGKSYLLVLINAVEGMEDEFNNWYDNIHLPEVVAVKGILSARRFKMHKKQMVENQPHKYMAMYEIEHGKEEQAIESLNNAVPAMDMQPVADFDMANSMIIESIGDLLEFIG